MTIKLLLLGSLVLAALLAYRLPVNARSSALRRVAGAIVIMAAVVSVLWPNLVSDLAQVVGVGRGADLLLYCLAMVSVFVSLSLYRRIHELEQRLVTLVRGVSIESRQGPQTDPRQPMPEPFPRHASADNAQQPSS